MIRSFKHRGHRTFYPRRRARQVSPEHVRKLKRILAALDHSHTPQDMDVWIPLAPSDRALEGFYAVSVSRNSRVTFRREDGHAVNVDYTD